MDYGLSYRFPSRRQAEEADLTHCYANARKLRDCRVLSWCADTCGRLAFKPDSGKNDSAWGADWGSRWPSARRSGAVPEGCGKRLRDHGDGMRGAVNEVGRLLVAVRGSHGA
jgi:hypothetical protein